MSAPVNKGQTILSFVTAGLGFGVGGLLAHLAARSTQVVKPIMAVLAGASIAVGGGAAAKGIGRLIKRQ